MRIEAYAATNCGLVRSNNEDAFVVRCDDLGLVGVADGVGGHQAGEIASQLAVNALRAMVSFSLLRQEITLDECQEMLRLAFVTAGRGIVDQAERIPEYRGMGTTLVAFLKHPTTASGLVAHVGDSRAYLSRNGHLERLTVDHTLAEELAATGQFLEDSLRIAETRNVLTRALGIKQPYEVDMRRVALEADDRFLLCTDGLTDVVSDQEIRAALARPGASDQQVAEEMIALALERGGPDNVTVAVGTVRAD